MSPLKIILLVSFVWFLFRLIRTPREPALRVLVVFLALRLLSAPSTIVAIRDLSGGVLTPSMAKLLMNLLLIASLYCLTLFFLISAAGPGAYRRAKREAVLLLVVGVVLTVAILATPNADEVYPASGSLPTLMRIPGVAVFYLVGNLYFTYALAQAGRWALRYAAESTRRAAWGLRIAALGLGTVAFGDLLRAVFVVIRWSGGTVPTSIAEPANMVGVVGFGTFVVGVCLVGLAARVAGLRVWLRHVRIYRELRPLWELLNEAFPDNALDRQPRALWPSLARAHRHYWRRVVEIRDGLVQISPHLADIGSAPDDPVHTQVTAIREAIRRQREGQQPSSSSATLVAAPHATSPDADVEQLVRLARAIDEREEAHAAVDHR